MEFEIASLVVPAGRRAEDRVGAFELPNDAGVILVVADGAGGTGGGDAAAQAVLDRVASAPASDPMLLLRECDQPEIGGETTAVLVRVRGGLIDGAAVGDSGAMLLEETQIAHLSSGIERKPLLGSGRARPGLLGAGPFDPGATLLVATDGLLKYTTADRIAAAVRATPDLSSLPERLVELVKLRNGTLQDDVGIVVCRRRAPR